MRAASYDRRVTIEQKTVTPDPDYGTPAITWTPFATRIAAQVQDTLPSKSESVQQGIRIAAKPARVRIRYLSGVSSDMRVVVHGLTDRVMQITGGPAELGRREGIEIVCEEYSTQGNP
ncbi:MAG: head-tail adaptor protein [Rhodoferax sp.]|nr:head-tail adaptor protein [Rhodoferax sp.]MDP3650900.1 head-tail adaptor protein [Rhodoferax sp.]